MVRWRLQINYKLLVQCMRINNKMFGMNIEGSGK